jgi:hypothetical protein
MPGTGDGVGAPEVPDAEGFSQDMRVKVRVDSGSPLVNQSPAEGQLCEVAHAEGPECPSSDNGYTDVTGQYGTLGGPNVSQNLAADALYIQGAPTTNDVRQGGFPTAI